MSDVNELIEAQIQSQGVSAIKVSDGHVFTFTLETLQRMVEQAQATGRVVVFVKHGAVS